MATTTSRPVTTRNHGEHDPVTPRNRDLSDRLRDAMTRCGVQIKEIAHAWDCSHVYVSLVLSGEKALTDVRIEQLPAAVQVALAEEWCADLGLLVGARAAAIGALTAACHLLALDERLPLKAGPPAKATLDTEIAPARRRA